MKGRFIESGITFNASKGGLFDNSVTSNNVTDAIVGLESGGNYKAFNPDGGGSGAVGKYQFRWDIWKDKIQKQTGVKSKEEFLNNPELQDAFYNNYYIPKEAIPAINRIKASTGVELDDNKLMKLYHFRGEQGAKDYLRGKVADKAESYNMSISKYTGIPKMRFGGVIPQKNFGGALSAYSSLIQPVSQLIEGDGTNVARSTLAGGLQFGVVGAVAKGLQAQQAYKLQQTQESKARFNSLPNSASSYAQLNMNPNVGYYAKGGLMNPDYEAEKGEVVVGNPQLEESKELAPGLHEVGGQSHENGGTMGKGGEFMFSNDINLNENGLSLLSAIGIKIKDTISFSEAAKKVATLKNKYSFPSTRYRENNTNKLMSMKIDSIIMQLAQLQENIKQGQ